MTVGFRWQIPPERAFPELTEAYVRAIRAGVHGVMQRWAPEIENWMKANAPWTDRTTHARQGLWSDVDLLGESTVSLILAHGMDYGIFLELANAGTYAIIGPALDYFAPRIWADIERMLR